MNTARKKVDRNIRKIIRQELVTLRERRRKNNKITGKFVFVNTVLTAQSVEANVRVAVLFLNQR